MSETKQSDPADPAVVADPASLPSVAGATPEAETLGLVPAEEPSERQLALARLRARLEAVRGRARDARRQNMLDQAAQAVEELATILIDELGAA